MTKNSLLGNNGFTLIELLVVIAIISILSSVSITSLRSARIKTYDTIRMHNLRTLKTALENYYLDHNEYPSTFTPGDFIIGPDGQLIPGAERSECFTHEFDYIPDLVPKYIARLPSDPAKDCSSTNSTVPHSWYYASDGFNYKLMTHMQNAGNTIFVDPAQDGGVDFCKMDKATPDTSHYAIWSEQPSPHASAACWFL